MIKKEKRECLTKDMKERNELQSRLEEEYGDGEEREDDVEKECLR